MGPTECLTPVKGMSIFDGVTITVSIRPSTYFSKYYYHVKPKSFNKLIVIYNIYFKMVIMLFVMNKIGPSDCPYVPSIYFHLKLFGQIINLHIRTINNPIH